MLLIWSDLATLPLRFFLFIFLQWLGGFSITTALPWKIKITGGSEDGTG